MANDSIHKEDDAIVVTQTLNSNRQESIEASILFAINLIRREGFIPCFAIVQEAMSTPVMRGDIPTENECLMVGGYKEPPKPEQEIN